MTERQIGTGHFVQHRPKRWRNLDSAIENVQFARGVYHQVASLHPHSDTLPQLAQEALDAERLLRRARAAMAGDGR